MWVVVDVNRAPLGHLRHALEQKLPPCVHLFDLTGEFLNRTFVRVRQCQTGRQAWGVTPQYDFTFPSVVPESKFPLSPRQEAPEPANPSVSRDVLSACTCDQCGHARLFPTVGHAFQQVHSYKKDGFHNLQFRLCSGLVFNLPYAVTSAEYAFRVTFTSRGQRVVQTYKSLGKLLNRLEKFRTGLRKLSVEVLGRRQYATPQETRCSALLKHDHAQNLHMVFYREYTNVRVVVPVRDLRFALEAVQSSAYRPNSDYAYRLLRGYRLAPGQNPGFPVHRRQTVFPLFRPLLDLNESSPLLEPTLTQCLPFPSVLVKLTLDYYSDVETKVSGPLEESALPGFFRDPLFDPRLLDLVGLFVACPDRCAPLADAYNSSRRPPDLF